MIKIDEEELEILTGDQTVRLIKNANDALRNSRSSGIMQRLDDIVKLVILKIFDEVEYESGIKDKYDFQVMQGDTIDSVYSRLSDLFKRNIMSSQFSVLYPENQKKFSTDEEGIYNIAKLWGKYKFKESFNDIKGAAFQEILKNTFDKNENQQFFTPLEAAEFMADLAVEMMKQKDLKDISACDPAIGTGGLLLQLRKSTNNSEGELNVKYYGADYDERMAWLSAINIYLSTGEHGDIKWENCIGGSLNKNKSFLDSERFDLILSNPPFGSDVTSDEVLTQYTLGGKSSRRRSILFMERNLELLKPGGTLVMVIDESVLNSGKTGDVRKYIRDNANIKAVFSLPNTTFLPYATVKTSIIVLEKKHENELSNDESVLYYEILNTGRKPNGDIDFKKNSTGEKVVNSDFSEAVNVFKKKLSNISVEDTNNSHTEVSNSEFMIQARENNVRDWKESRIDMLPYHPMVKNSNMTLSQAKHIMELKEIVSIRSERINSINYPNRIFNYIGLANVEKEIGEYEVEEVFGDDIKSTCNKFYAEDIIFARMRPELRKVAVIDDNINEGICSSECAVIYINDEYVNKISVHYLAWILRSDLFYGQVMGKVTGIGRPRISSKGLMNCKVPIPSLEIQNKIVKELDHARNDLLNVRLQTKQMHEESQNNFRNKIKNINEQTKQVFNL